MSEHRRDDTPSAGSRNQGEREPHDYYYDDGTGYEPYDPQRDEEGQDEGEESDSDRARQPKRRPPGAPGGLSDK